MVYLNHLSQGALLQYSMPSAFLCAPERACKLAVATMILLTICILHGLQLQQEAPYETDEDCDIVFHDPTTCGQLILQTVIKDYFN